MSRSSILQALRKLPGNKRRVDILEPGLCNDIVERLAPSLAPYAGCTIIDINPGVGLFSTKLNNLLRPKRHILLEPRAEHYETFLKPLLDRPTSQLHIPDLSDERSWDPLNYGEDGLIPGSSGSAGAGGAGSISDSPILLVANVAGRPIGKKEKSYTDPGHRALDYARSVRQAMRSGSERTPRMLLWMNGTERQNILPRTVGNRNKLACVLEANCHVEEVAGTALTAKGIRREDALVIEGERRVAAAMQQNGIVSPSHRVSKEASTVSGQTNTSRHWHEEMRALEEGFKNQKIPQYIGLPPGPIVLTTHGKPKKGGNPKTSASNLSPEWRRWKYLQRTFQNQIAVENRLKEYLQLQEEIDRLDLLAYTETTDADERETRLQAVDVKIRELKERLTDLSEADYLAYLFLDDDRRAFRMDPPLLLWDRRTAEPILAQPEEFTWRTETALLDFTPRSDWKSLPVTTAEHDIYVEALAAALMNCRLQTGLKFLDALGMDAYEAVVQHAPFFRDPRNGGRRDLDGLRGRVIPPDMYSELAAAWQRWGFKPPVTHMLRSIDLGQILVEKRKLPGETKFYV